jgi:hypothetical protein
MFFGMDYNALNAREPHTHLGINIIAYKIIFHNQSAVKNKNRNKHTVKRDTFTERYEDNSLTEVFRVLSRSADSRGSAVSYRYTAADTSYACGKSRADIL